MSLLVEEAALMLSVQDEGRSGYRRYGLPASGPMDWWAFRCANRLVGNPDGAACLELGFSASVIRLGGDALLAVCGAGYEVRLNQRVIPMWMAFLAKAGDRLTLQKIPGGNWAYLAAAGGLLSQQWLASRSAYPRAGLGGMLSPGDRLQLADLSFAHRQLAGQCIPITARPSYGNAIKLRVVPGPHLDWFEGDSLAGFWGSGYQVSTQSDRMGYRLRGTALKHRDGANLISQGMVPGEIQVPSDGQPIVMMADHPTTGGYPCLGTVIKVDLPLLAQIEFLQRSVYFTPISVERARASMREVLQNLTQPIETQEDPWHPY